MRRTSSRKGPGRSSVLIAPDHAGNVVGIDPHKRTLSAAVVDARGGIVASEHFRVSGEGHRALEAWARQFGPIARWGIENATGWGRHTAIFLVGRGDDVRDVCPNRTSRSDRARQRGKSDTLDAERIARETLAHPLLPRAFKRAAGAGPDEQTELLGLWHRTRRSILTSRQHLLNDYRTRIGQLDADERAACRELAALVQASASTLDQLCGLSTRSVAELLAEVGDPRRFTTPGFARFNGTAPLPASTAEGPGEPVRHHYNPGGNRRINAILHRMAVTQLRCDPRAQALYARARERGHTN